MNILDLPFNEHVGLQIVQFRGSDVVSLDPQPHHQNHVGTVHASALYSLAEAASGHRLLQNEEIATPNTVALLRSSTVKYRNPATGPVMAIAHAESSDIARLLERLSRKGRGAVDIQVKIVNDQQVEHFTGTFGWYIARS